MLNSRTIKIIILCITSLTLPLSVYATGKSNSDCKGKYIQLQTENKLSFTAYVAGPKQAKQGILLIHGWWGLNEEVETWANNYAKAGYRVMAVDL